MGFRGGRGGSFSGSSSSRGGSRGGYGGGRSFGSSYDSMPEELVPLGTFLHASEGDMFCKSVNEKIPYFNAPVFLENKVQIGKVDEILGPINEVHFTVKCQDGVVATSFKAKDQVFVGSDKLLPLDRFLPKPKAAKGPRVKKAAGAPRGGSRGGFSSRGGSRGGFSSRGGSRGGFGGSSRGGSSRGSFGSRGGSFGGRGGFRGRN